MVLKLITVGIRNAFFVQLWENGSKPKSGGLN